jgi:hypothetical protein
MTTATLCTMLLRKGLKVCVLTCCVVLCCAVLCCAVLCCAVQAVCWQCSPRRLSRDRILLGQWRARARGCPWRCSNSCNCEERARGAGCACGVWGYSCTYLGEVAFTADCRQVTLVPHSGQEHPCMRHLWHVCVVLMAEGVHMERCASKLPLVPLPVPMLHPPGKHSTRAAGLQVQSLISTPC